MFCRNCGKELTGTPEICMNCGAKPLVGSSFCYACGAETNPLAEICIKCGVRLTEAGVKVRAGAGERKWMPTAAGILSIIAGGIAFFLSSWIIFFGSGVLARAIFGSALAAIEFGFALAVIAIVAIIGGGFALRKRVWGLALAGAICSVLCSLILGIPAVVFVVMSRQEFK